MTFMSCLTMSETAMVSLWQVQSISVIFPDNFAAF
jgi:hypothetical protein